MEELRVLFIVLNFILDKRLQDNPEGGIKADEYKVKYKKLKSLLKKLEYHTMIRSSLERYGACKDCEHFSKEGRTKNYGVCTEPVTKQRPVTHFGQCRYIYDTCSFNTSRKGGV